MYEKTLIKMRQAPGNARQTLNLAGTYHLALGPYKPQVRNNFSQQYQNLVQVGLFWMSHCGKYRTASALGIINNVRLGRRQTYKR